jgi:hypothetical protein
MQTLRIILVAFFLAVHAFAWLHPEYVRGPRRGDWSFEGQHGSHTGSHGPRPAA